MSHSMITFNTHRKNNRKPYGENFLHLVLLFLKMKNKKKVVLLDSLPDQKQNERKTERYVGPHNYSSTPFL